MDLELSLQWESAHVFHGQSPAGGRIVLDGSSKAGASPVEAVAFALAGCMSIDIVDILHKGRFKIAAFCCDVAAQRRTEPPRRITAVRLTFHVKGDTTEDRLVRAIELSKERYCSVWHTLQTDIEFETAFRLEAE
jgi:putative redox protein